MPETNAGIPSPTALIIMGVSGSGKTTTGRRLAERLEWDFRDADSFHPESNIAKMSAGTPLTDEDRWPWLASISGWIGEHLKRGESAIVTCSALKRVYRDVLVAGRPEVRIVHLSGTRSLIGQRMAARRDHFMPPGLLESQFATLEAPDLDERAILVDVNRSPSEVTEKILSALTSC